MPKAAPGRRGSTWRSGPWPAALAAALLLASSLRAGAAEHELRVGSEVEFPPYAFVDRHGQAAGFSVDLIRAVANTMGLRLAITTGPWDRVWNDLVAGRLDVLPIVARLPQRADVVDFSLPHTETFDAFFVRSGDTPPRDLEAARGAQIVVMRSDAAHHELLGRKFAGTVIPVETILDGLRLVAAGRHTAFLGPKIIGMQELREHGVRGLVAGPAIPDYVRIFSFAVKKGDADLAEKLNQGLLIVKANGEYDRIYRTWLSYDDPWMEYRRYVVPAASAILLLVLLAGVWLLVLRRTVARRTAELAEKNALLQRAGVELENRVAQRTEELARANAGLQEEVGERLRTEAALRESEAKFSVLFEAAPIALSLVTATDAALLDVNRAWLELTGIGSKEEVLGKSSVELGLAGDREARARILETLRREGSVRQTEAEVQLRNRAKRILLVDIHQVAIGGRPFILTASVDITERKVAEQQLRELNETLEQRVAERTVEVSRQAAQLRALAAQLVQAEHRERKRLAGILHDHIQQLLVVARMQLDWMKRETSLERLRAGALSADAVLREAVEVSRSLAVDLSPPALREAGLVGGLKWLATRMGEKNAFAVSLRADNRAEPPDEETRLVLFECARELLLNALKHAGVSEAQVALRLTTEGLIALTVQDHGRGFAPEALRGEQTNGVSFGLFSIRERLAHVGGRLEIDSGPGRGTLVTLTVPSGAGAASGEQAPGLPTVDDRRRELRVRLKVTPCRVLIVDDHRIIREGLRGLLEVERDIEVVGEAADGAAALDLARELHPDVVVIDVNLPGMSGLEVTRRIVAEHGSTKVIGLSMYSDREMGNAMREAGAVSYLTKGGPSEDLVAAIRACGPRGVPAPRT